MRFLIYDVTGSHGDVIRIKEKERKLKEVYVASDREDELRSHQNFEAVT